MFEITSRSDRRSVIVNSSCLIALLISACSSWELQSHLGWTSNGSVSHYNMEYRGMSGSTILSAPLFFSMIDYFM